jgi:hypothetical protein
MATTNSIIPVGLCQCGCGGKTAIATENVAKRGQVKGQPNRFLPRHSRKAGRSQEAFKRGNGICIDCKVEFPLSLGMLTKRKSGRCKECLRKWHANYRATRPDHRSTWLEKWYGITHAKYVEMWNDQNGLCAICLHPEVTFTKVGTLRPLCVDHCHETGKVRGLLCSLCNNGIGRLEDDPQLVQNALNYLIKNKGTYDGLRIF